MQCSILVRAIGFYTLDSVHVNNMVRFYWFYPNLTEYFIELLPRELSWISISLRVTDVGGLKWENLWLIPPDTIKMVMTQTRLASFLSPVAAAGPCTQSLPCGQGSPAPTRVPSGPCTQSLPCGQVSPASTRDPRSAERRSTSPVLPEHGRKSKKVKRAESKAKRKRDKNARAKSRISTSVRNLHDSTSTPMSSDNAISGVVNDDGVSFLSDRSLREMLASADERSREDADSSGDNIDHQQRLIEVESKLVATAIALEGEQDETTRLKAHIELLESEYSEQKSELDNLRKILGKQKSDLKRLYRDNDSLRREISRYSGIRKYTDGANNIDTDNRDKLVNEMADAHAEFRDRITDITGLLVDALDTCPGDKSEFTCVTNKRGKSRARTAASQLSQSPTYSQVLSSTMTSPMQSTSFQPTTSHQPVVARLSPASRQSTASRQPDSASRQTPASRQSQTSRQSLTSHRPLTSQHSPASRQPASSSGNGMGQPIPVVQPGIGRPQTASNPIPSHVNLNQHPRHMAAEDRNSVPRPNHHPATRDKTVVIGTSLINGLGQHLSNLGEEATTYMYRGATVPVIQNRIKHILNSRQQPERVVLQCGGNDAERQPAEVISTRIESLVHDIKRICPTSDIIINKVPPRGKNQKVLNNIKRLNSSLEYRYQGDENVQVIDVCPKAPQFYRKDLTHFNFRGSFQFAKQLSDHLSNFHWLDRRMWI